MKSNELLEIIAESVHNAWWEEKKKQGVTDHPDMIPYKDLAENVKEYDRVTVRAVLKSMVEFANNNPYSLIVVGCNGISVVSTDEFIPVKML